MAISGWGGQGQAPRELALLGCCFLGEPRHSSLSFQKADSRTRRAIFEPQEPVTTASPTKLDQITSGMGGAATCAPTPDGGFPRLPRPPLPAGPRSRVLTRPADATPLASSVLSSLPPEVERLSFSGYGSPNGGGGRTGQRSGGGGGNGGAGAGAERSGGDEGRGLRGRPAPGPAGTGVAGWREHRSPRRSRAEPGGEEGVRPGVGRQLGLTPQPGLAVPGGSCTRGGAEREGATVRPRPSLSGGSPRCLQQLGQGLPGTPGPIACGHNWTFRAASERGVLRFARGGDKGAHGEDPGVDRRRLSQGQ